MRQGPDVAGETLYLHDVQASTLTGSFSVYRNTPVSDGSDGYTDGWSAVASGILGAISQDQHSGAEADVGGLSQRVSSGGFVVHLDPDGLVAVDVEVLAGDRLRDEATSKEYEVLNVEAPVTEETLRTIRVSLVE